jgi:hypothetical protein
MQPIPLRFLKSTIKYYELADGRYEGVYNAPVTIKNVLINFSKTVMKQTPANQTKQSKGTLYLDAINTKPFIQLSYGSKIIDEAGNDFYVMEVKPVQAFTLHHYQVTLM